MGLLGKLLLAMAALAIAAFLGRSYVHDGVFKDTHARFSKSQTTVEVELGGAHFTPALNKIRHQYQRQSGKADILDLFFLWPSLKGYSEETAAVFDDPAQRWRTIYVTIEALKTPIPSQKVRLDHVYRRFFKGKAWRGPGGLLGQKLDPASGYDGEDVYYGRDGDKIFVTRCLNAEKAKATNVTATCLHDFKLMNTIQVVIRFDKRLLSKWRIISSAIRRQLLTIVKS